MENEMHQIDQSELPIKVTNNHMLRLIHLWRCRVNQHNIPKGKTLIKLQTEFFVGAYSMIDALNAETLNLPLSKIPTSMPPLIYICILRGDNILEYKF